MKTLITGGAGFIGSHLAELLLQKGHKVCVVDNLRSGRLKNLDAVKNHPDLTIFQEDIGEAKKIEKLSANVDWIFHLAALADVVPSIENPETYFEVNVSGTLKMLECAKKNRVKRFIYAASSSCYGVPKAFPTSESADIATEHPYALTKYIAEELVLHWSKVFHIPCVSLRLFNVYGPRSRTSGAYGAVFGVFLAQKWHKMPFTVVGDGKQTRDFTYVGDVAEAFLKAAESNVSGEIFNVGSGQHHSINRLVELLGGEVVYIPKRPGEPDCTFADITKIQKILKWQPKVSFEQGVKKMLSSLEDYKDAPLWDPQTIEKATMSWFHYLELEKSHV